MMEDIAHIPKAANTGNCFIEFRVDDSHRCRLFLELFDALKLETPKHSHLEFGVNKENSLRIVLTTPMLSPEVHPSVR